MQMNNKPVGWRNEPQRHGLAARGIKTTYLGGIGMDRGAEIVTVSGDRLIFPETGDRFVDGARFEHFLDDLGMAGFDEGKDWEYYTEGGVYGITIFNPDILVNQRSLDAFERWGYKVSHSLDAGGDPIVLGIKGRGSFDGDVKITLEGADELLPLLQSRGVRTQALKAFNSSSGTQTIEGSIEGVEVNLTVTHPGENLYHVEGDLYYHIDRTFTRKELMGFYDKAKRLM